MELDPTRMCELLVGLPAVNVLGVEETDLLRVRVETDLERPRCGDCGGRVWVKDPPGRGVGRPSMLRAADAAHVAQAPLAVPERVVSGRVVD